MPNMSPYKTPMPTQNPMERCKNFSEVATGYTEEMAIEEAKRCLNCKNKPCISGCPVIISLSNSLPAVCGRVCPQEMQCEGKCVRGIKGESVAIGRLERFVADWHRNNAKNRTEKPAQNGHKIAVIGSGPSGLACAGELAKRGYEVTIFEALHTAGGVLVYGIFRYDEICPRSTASCKSRI